MVSECTDIVVPDDNGVYR